MSTTYKNPNIKELKVTPKMVKEFLHYCDDPADLMRENIGYRFYIVFDTSMMSFRLYTPAASDLEHVVDVFKEVDSGAFFAQRYCKNKIESYLFSVSPFGFFPVGLLTDVLKEIATNTKINPFLEPVSSLVLIGPKAKLYIVDFLFPLSRMVKERGLDPLTFEPDNISVDRALAVEEVRALRQYQKDAITNFIFSGKGRGLIESPTGSGKSFIIANLIYTLNKQLAPSETTWRYLIYVPNTQLVEQFYTDLLAYGYTEQEVCRFSGSVPAKERRDPLGFQIVVANAAYCLNHMSEIGKVDVLICDEAHKTGAAGTAGFVRLQEMTGTKVRAGFTGTLPAKGYNRWQLIGLIGSVVYNMGIVSLQDEGFLAMLKFTKFSIVDKVVERDRDLLFNLDSNYRLNDVDASGEGLIGVNDAWIAEQDWMVENAKRLFEPVYNYIADEQDPENEKKNTLIIFDRISVGQSLFQTIDDDKKRGNFSGGVYYIDGGTDVKSREEIRAQLESTTGNILVGQSSILSTGWNCKNLHRLVLLAGGKSQSKTIQSIGRTLRLHKNKKYSEVVDCVYNFKYSRRHASERKRLYKEFYEFEKYDQTFETDV